MRRIIFAIGLAIMVTACVTINVYFPEAEAEKAADQFIEDVIAPTDNNIPEIKDPQTNRRMINQANRISVNTRAMSIFDFFISSAQAQTANIKIETPAIVAIQKRMRDRFVAKMEKWYDTGAIGFTTDGMVEVKDQSAVPLSERTNLRSIVAEDNRDRDAVYREIAIANDHSEWEPQIRQAFAEEWVDNARKGWFYKDSAGTWKRK